MLRDYKKRGRQFGGLGLEVIDGFNQISDLASDLTRSALATLSLEQKITLTTTTTLPANQILFDIEKAFC